MWNGSDPRLFAQTETKRIFTAPIQTETKRKCPAPIQTETKRKCTSPIQTETKMSRRLKRKRKENTTHVNSNRNETWNGSDPRLFKQKRICTTPIQTETKRICTTPIQTETKMSRTDSHGNERKTHCADFQTETCGWNTTHRPHYTTPPRQFKISVTPGYGGYS